MVAGVRPPRVLQVISSFGVGGAEAMLLKLVRALHGRGVDFHAVSMTGDGPIGVQLREAGVATSFLGMRRGIPNPLALARLRRVVATFRPDLLQTWMYHADLLGGLVGRAAGLPVIWGIRSGALDRTTTKRTTLATRKACAWLSGQLPAAIVSCSRAATAEHVRIGYRADRLKTIPNGFDLSRYRPDPVARAQVRHELGVGEAQPLIGLVARHDPAKDFPTFLGAVAELRRSRPAVAFLACGDGVTSDNPALASQCRAAGVGAELLLLGRRADVPRVMAALDIATLSSRREGFPNVIGEAMACAVPAVVTDVGDAAWIVGDAGVAVPAGDPAALAGAWAALLDLEPAARHALGAAARARIEADFELGQTVRRFRALYAEVLGSSARPT